MIVSEFLFQKLEELRAELEKMRPAYLSYVELQKAITSLEKTLEGRRAGRPAGGRTAKEGKSRAEQVMHHVSAEPGITVNALVERTGTARSYIDRVLRALEKEGRIERRKSEGEGRDQWGFWVKRDGAS